ncbi:MAG: 50S ribosomal protein L10 [Bacillota bacterium]
MEGKAVRAEKLEAVEELVHTLRRAQSVIITDYRGLNVAAMTRLRRNLREAGVEYRVVKNSLVHFAAEKVGITGMDPYLAGPTALALGYDDPVAPAKVLTAFAAENRQLIIKAGVLSGRIIVADDVKALATLPSREVLLGRVLGAFMSPMTGLASVLAAPVRGLTVAVEALRKQREEAA